MKGFDIIDYGFQAFASFVDGKPRTLRLTYDAALKDCAMALALNHSCCVKRVYVMPDPVNILTDEPFDWPVEVPNPVPFKSSNSNLSNYDSRTKK